PHQRRCVTTIARGCDRRDTEDADREVGLVAHGSTNRFAADAAEPVRHPRIGIRRMDAADRNGVAFTAEAAHAYRFELGEIVSRHANDLELRGSRTVDRPRRTDVPHLEPRPSKPEGSQVERIPRVIDGLRSLA